MNEFLHQGQRITISWDPSATWVFSRETHCIWAGGFRAARGILHFTASLGMPWRPGCFEGVGTHHGPIFNQKRQHWWIGAPWPTWNQIAAQLNNHEGGSIGYIGIASFRPQVVEHTAGITNVTYDALNMLSRLNQPGGNKDFPNILRGVPYPLVTKRGGDHSIRHVSNHSTWVKMDKGDWARLSVDCALEV